MPGDTNIDKFYNQLQTLPKLISDIALSIAEAQRRMDQNYIEQLAAFTKIVQPLLKQGAETEQYTSLFRAIAPSRYQFSETVVEVRADLQMTTASETGIEVDAGIKTPVFAATVNASYVKRSAFDYQASALIRTQLNAVPSDLDVLTKLLDREAKPGADLPNVERYKALEDLFKSLPQKSLPAPPGGGEPGRGA